MPEVSLSEELRGIVGAVLEVWRFQIAEIGGTSITLGKVVIALLLILFGGLISRLLSRALTRRVFARFGMAEGALAAIQVLVFYALLFFFVLWALRLVEIPLTVFTLLGGALAIGVGFGSQNLVNNFLSGLIILMERPIKVGDLVDVDGTFGSVEAIGARSTRVRSGDNTHIIVPNSSFLEKNVVNWTLSDPTVRTQVDVGVAYGSPTREVSRLLLQAAKKHGRVLDNPAPEVLFMNFGDNALEFRLYFWVRIRRVLDRQRVGSDLRHSIDHMFRDAGITIAFPQRDVHLDSLSPVEVRMLDAEQQPSDRAPGKGEAREEGRGERQKVESPEPK